MAVFVKKRATTAEAPTATAQSEMSSVTTAPAPRTQCPPNPTPGSSITRAPVDANDRAREAPASPFPSVALIVFEMMGCREGRKLWAHHDVLSDHDGPRDN